MSDTPTVSSRIAELGSMHQREFLTDEEFALLKQDLLTEELPIDNPFLDELAALSRLVESGALTREEYELRKTVLWGSDDATINGPSLRDGEHPGATAVSVVFKVTAWLVLILGVIASISFAVSLSHAGFSSGRVFAAIVGSIFGTILAGAAFAFFAYVLDLLMSIDSKTHG